jgi:hypothetical protein
MLLKVSQLKGSSAILWIDYQLLPMPLMISGSPFFCLVLFADHLRHRYENARVLKAYGTLLSKWDKRERLGEEYLAKAETITNQLPTFSNKIQLNQMVHLPTA